ncbi:MAG: ABC transporter permease [Alphaproteobacteria bacterium]|nr:MAG: ABC transporter permease [Alphaproteobacteria bacterium]
MGTARIWFTVLARAIITALLVYLVVFLAFAVLPLNPARAVLGPLADESAVAALNARFGFDAPLHERLVLVASRMLQGDFGVSIVFGQPVVPLVAGALSTTLARLAVAVPLGSLAALWLVPRIVTNDWRAGRFGLVAAAAMPSFVLLALLLMVFGSFLAFAPSQARVLYEGLAIFVSALVVMASVSLILLDRLDFRADRSRQADFLMLMRAPADRMVSILMRGAMPSVLAATANSVAPALTALTFAEFVFGLPGFGVMFMRACDNGDLAIVAFGSLVLAVILTFVQGIADAVAARADRRLN